MADQPAFSESTDDDPFTSVAAEYLRRAEADLSPAALKALQNEFLARHSAFADRLRKLFENEAAMRELAAAALTGPHIPGSQSDTAPLLPERYKLLDKIGDGGMGTVWKADDTVLNRAVALKLILTTLAASAEHCMRFKIEAEAVARLQHPHIVQLFDVGEHAGLPYLALEFLEGGTLEKRLHKDQTLPGPEAAALVEKLARAIQHAHERGVIHRDLKPTNVLFTGNGEPKVTDFGLAKRLDSDQELSQPGTVVGTLLYMAPEQARGETREVGPAADVWALGAILYECLTGQVPFRGANALETRLQIIETAPVPPTQRAPKCPRDLETICLKCLHKETTQRYLTAGALADDLRRFLEKRPIKARRVGLLERARLGVRRRPAVAGLLLVSVVAAAGLTWLGWENRQKTKAKEQERSNRQVDTRLRVGQALQKARLLQGEARPLNDLEKFGQALLAARGAAELLALGEADAELKREVAALAAELEQERAQAEALAQARLRDGLLLHALDGARVRKAFLRGDDFDYVTAVGAYAAAFLAYGVDLDALPAEEIAQRLADRPPPVRSEAANALTELGMLRVATHGLAILAKPLEPPPPPDPSRWERLFEAADRIDPNPWRANLRQTLCRPNLLEVVGGMLILAKDVRVEEHPVASLTLLAEALAGFGHPAPAVNLLRRTHERFPDDFWVNYFLTINAGHTTPPRWEDAARYGTAAVALRPESVLAHYNLGVAFLELRRYADAVTAFRAAQRMGERQHQPDFVPVWINLGYALDHAGDAAGAAAAWKRAIAIDSRSVETLGNYANILLAAGDCAQAETILRQCTLLAPRDHKTHYNLGILYGVQERWEEALAPYQQARELAPGLYNVRLNLAQDLHELGRYEDALREYAEARRQIVAAGPEHARLLQVLDGEVLPRCRREQAQDALLPELVKGEVEPATEDDRRAAALAVWRRGAYASSARLFVETFAGGDRAWIDRQTYHATCAAARAAGDPQVPEAEQALWRGRALEWLRNDLKLWPARYQGDLRPWVVTRMRRWQMDPHLAGVRDAEALTRLSDAERTEWEATWAAVKKLAAE